MNARNVLVTGTSSGIGRATTLTLAAEGYRVFAGVRRTIDGESLVNSSQHWRGEIVPLVFDVTDPASIGDAAGVVSRAVGDSGLGGLVNNAGIGMTWPVEALPLDELRHVYEVNVFGQVAVTQAFLPLLRAGTGRVITIGSIGDRLSLPFGAPLTSAKWALASITESLRLELRPWGIHVVLIEPACIHTAAISKAKDDAERVLRQMSDTGRQLYATAYQSMMLRGLAREGDGSHPDVVARAVLRALTANRPRTRYLVGKDAYKHARVARWAPDWLFDRIRITLFGLPQQFGSAAAQNRPVTGAPR